MRLYEYVLAADKQADLCVLAHAREWLLTQPFFATVREDIEQTWTAAERRLWRDNIQILRGVAAVLHPRRRYRPSSLSTAEAMAACERWLNRCWISLEPGDAIPFGVRMGALPDRADMSAKISGRDIGRRQPKPFSLHSRFDRYWMWVFWSVLSQGQQVCQDCGRELPATATGRPSRLKRCQICRNKRWRDKLPQEQKQKMWRSYKQKQRQRARRRQRLASRRGATGRPR